MDGLHWRGPDCTAQHDNRMDWQHRTGDDRYASESKGREGSGSNGKVARDSREVQRTGRRGE